MTGAGPAFVPPPDLGLTGPIPLGQQRIPAGRHGAYVIAAGPLVAAIGKGGGRSGHLAGPLNGLAKLGIHRASRRVLCAAYCHRAWPQVWYRVTEAGAEEALEEELKRRLGKPEIVAAACHRAEPLLAALREAAKDDPWAAGYIEAVFEVGERLDLILADRFAGIWQRVGLPSGPGAE